MKRRFVLLALVALLLLILSACGRGDDNTEDVRPSDPPAAALAQDNTAQDNTAQDNTAQDNTAQDNTAQEEAIEAPAADSSSEEPAGEESASEEPAADAPAQEAAPPALTTNALDQLSSYRSNIVWSVAQDGTTLEEVTMSVVETSSPQARSIAVASTQGDFQMVQIENDVWVQVEGQWQQLPAAAAEGMMSGQMFFSPGDLTEAAASSSDFAFLGTEEVNGVSTNHYRMVIDPSDLPQAAAAGNVQNVNAEVWVVNQPDLPEFAMRMTINYEGTYEGQQSTTDLQWEIEDVNDPALVVEAPQ